MKFSMVPATVAVPPPAPPVIAARRPAALAATLYVLWSGLAWFAHVSGSAPVAPGSGWILGIGVVLTALLFEVLGQLPVGERPPATTTMSAEALMVVIWASLYTHFCQAPSELSPGMYLTAAIIVVPAGSLAWLRRIMAVSLVACGLTLLIGTGFPGATPAAELMTVLGRVGALAVMLLAVYLATLWFHEMRARFESRFEQLRHQLERTARKAELDELTSSYNRGYIMSMLEREKARADRTGESFCVCILDIDHFKAMNDQYGHLTGDRVLASFARRVRGELRSMDTVNRHGRESSLGRVGGEEFLVALPHTSLRGALRCAERIRRAVVDRPFNGLHQVTVSIGIAEYRPGEGVTGLLGRADEALYGAKRGGRNRVHGAGPNGGRSNVVMPDIPAAS